MERREYTDLRPSDADTNGGQYIAEEMRRCGRYDVKARCQCGKLWALDVQPDVTLYFYLSDMGGMYPDRMTYKGLDPRGKYMPDLGDREGGDE